MSAAEQAQTLRARLAANVDAWYADEITHDEFGQRQSETWTTIRAAGPDIEERVLALLREDMP
jgi:hypothetical protein